MLEVGGGVRVGEDPCQLLELERPLAGGRVFVPAREDEQPVRRRPGRAAIDSTSGSRASAAAIASGIATRAALSAGSPVMAADKAAIASSSVV